MKYIGIITCLLIVLFIRVELFFNSRQKLENGQKIDLVIELTNPVSYSAKQQTYSIQTTHTEPFYLVIPRYPTHDYGEIVHVVGTIEEKVISNKKTIKTMYFPKIEAIKKSNSPVLASVSLIRQHISSFILKSLPYPYGGILLGIVFGIKDDIPKDVTKLFQKVGVVHIVAASGMNVVFVTSFLVLLFQRFFLRTYSYLFAIAGIGLYAGVAGFEPPILRASIMGILVLVAQLVGRQYLSVFLLGFAIYIMLSISPDLIYHVGFQLSVTSTLGLLYIPNVIEKIIPYFFKYMSFFKEDFVTTFCASLSTLPLILYYFGSYSPWSLLVNMLILWTIPPLMLIGSVGIIVSFLFPFLAEWILYITMPLLTYLLAVVRIFSNLPGEVTSSFFPLPFIFAYYCFLLAGLFFLKTGFNNKAVTFEKALEKQE